MSIQWLLKNWEGKLRDSFIETLTDVASKNKNIILLTADLGFGIFDNFRKLFPDRFINVGIAEQNMIGIAAGLSNQGFKVVAYSIAPFVSMRCFEQIRNDIVYHNCNVTVVGSGGGFTYGALGFSHHAIEDLCLMNSLSPFKVIVPCCEYEMREATQHLLTSEGASYLRVEKNNFDTSQYAPFVFSSIRRLIKGTGDISIFATGGILENILSALNLISNSCKFSVYSVHDLTNLDLYKFFDSNANLTHLVFEEHIRHGGLGSRLLSEYVKMCSFPSIFKHFYVEHDPDGLVGDQNWLRQRNKLDVTSIKETLDSYV